MANEAKSKIVELTELGMSISINNHVNWFAFYMVKPREVQENLFKMLMNGQIVDPNKREAIQQMAIAKGWMQVIETPAVEKSEEKVEVPF